MIQVFWIPGRREAKLGDFKREKNLEGQ